MSQAALPAGHYWSRLRCHAWALEPAWPPLLIVVLYVALLFGADQVQDVAIGAVLDWQSLFGRAFTFALWNVLFGLAVWFSARLLLSQHRALPHYLPEGFTEPLVIRETAWSVLWLARLLGAAIPLVTALAFFLAGRHAVVHHHAAPAIDQFAAACIVVLIAWGRRGIAERFTRAGSSLRPRPALIPWARPRELGRTAIVVCLLWLSAALGCMIWAANDPVGMGQGLGPFAVLAIGLIGICFGLTALAFLQRVLHVPAFALALLLAVISSRTGDNHTLPALKQATLPPPVSLPLAYERFMAQPGPHRLLLVATAGGGIRAAFWTAYALGRLHDLAGGNFDSSLFSISGVSGGGVGAVFYRAMLAEQEHGLPVCTRGDQVPQTRFAPCAEHYLSQDGIGPTLAALLFPDLVQRFVPFPVLPDRAAALSAAWSSAWAKDAGAASGYMPGAFAALWQPDRPWPVLLLNGTSVAQGRRIVTSNLDLSALPDEFDDVQVFPRSYAISAATAGLNTARFPFVSPPGGIPAQGGMPADQIVDGGVFENSGAQTTLELLRWLLTRPQPTRPDIAILQITSDPDEAPGPPIPCTPAPPSPSDATAPRFLPDLTSGLTALFRSRGARGIAAMAALRVEACDAGLHYAAIRLQKQDKRPEPPLGWSLSGAAIASIEGSWPRQIDASHFDQAALNGPAVQALVGWLGLK